MQIRLEEDKYSKVLDKTKTVTITDGDCTDRVKSRDILLMSSKKEGTIVLVRVVSTTATTFKESCHLFKQNGYDSIDEYKDAFVELFGDQKIVTVISFKLLEYWGD